MAPATRACFATVVWLSAYIAAITLIQLSPGPVDSSKSWSVMSPKLSMLGSVVSMYFALGSRSP